MTETKQIKVQQAADKAHTIDSATRELLTSVKKKNNKAVLWFVVCWSILLIVGVVGIYTQAEIAQKNQKHIDCIVKLFTTPLPSTAKSRTISNPSTTCNINFN